MALSSSEDRMIVARVIWLNTKLWRMDKWTDGYSLFNIASRVLCIASYADAL